VSGGPIERYLAELAHALRRSPARERTLEEVREHLEDSAAAARILGHDGDAAEADAVARMGSVRTVAGRRRRRVPLALAVVLALGLAGGLALARSAGPTNLVGLAPAQRAQGRAAGTPVLSGLGSMRIVSLDPTTLAPQGTGVPLVTTDGTTTTWYFGDLPTEVAFGSPDGQRLGFVYDGAVQLLSLRPLRRTRSIRFAPTAPTYGPSRANQKAGSLTRVTAAAWLAGGRIALLVQNQGPPYASRVTARTLVVIDVATGGITRVPVALRGRVIGFASAAGRLVVLGCLDGATSLLAGDVSPPRARVVPLRAVRCNRTALPTVTVRADGGAAAVIGGDLTPAVVDLRTLQVRTQKPLAARKVILGHLAARFTAQGSIAITGAHEIVHRHQIEERGLGVVLVDPATGDVRTLTRTGSRLLVVGDTIVVSGFAAEAKGRGDGTGLTAFTSDGTRLWHADAERLVLPFESGQRVYAPRSVKRHTVVDAFDLASGRQLAELYQRGAGVRPITGATGSSG
jgi:hypothetical protein